MNVTIERIDGLPFGRCYKITKDNEIHFLPSVTTVLKMQPTPEYDIIRDELGPEKYKHAMQKAADRGTVMHKWLETFLEEYGKHQDASEALKSTQAYISATKEFDTLLTEKARALKIGRELFYNFYSKKFWTNITPIKKVLHNEIFMYTLFRGGWAGASDFVYQDFDDEHIIADFKSSREPKDESKIDTYRMQIACYMFKYSEMYGKIPARGEILIANEYNDKVQKIVVPRDDDPEHGPGMKHYLRKFLGLMTEFRATPEWVEFNEQVSREQVTRIDI